MGAIKGRSSVEAADVRNVPQENVAHFVIQEVIYIFSKPLVAIRAYEF